MPADPTPPPAPIPPETPDERLGPLVTERVRVDGRTFLLRRPDRSDHLLDDPAVRAAFLVDEYLPYWTDLWPAARMLAKAVLREPWPAGLTALELGCGLGLPGVVALARGLHVVFSDYDRTALRFAAANARLNGWTDFETRVMDWRCPPAGLRVPVILAADLVYELRSVEPLAALIKQVLAPGGICLLTDQDRKPAEALRAELPRAGLAFAARLIRAGEPGGQRYKGTLYRIRHLGPGEPGA